jgi:hypothetical protein
MRWSSPFRILLAVPCAACIAQVVKTVDNPMDGSRSVRIVISAQEPYKRTDGSEFTPSLGVSCNQTKSGKRSFDVILATGGVPTELYSYHPGDLLGGKDVTLQQTDEIWKPSCIKFPGMGSLPCLLVKFDEGKPTKVAARMNPDKDHIVAWPALDFIKPSLNAKTVYIEFPARNEGDVISQFDLSGLKAEFSKHPECTVK